MTTVVALMLVAAVAVPTTIALRGGGPGERLAGDVVALIDLESGELVDSVPLDWRPEPWRPAREAYGSRFRIGRP